MKVLLINSVCGRQSTGRIVTDIKKELIKQGHECVIAYGEAGSLADVDDYHIGSEVDRYIHAGLSRIFDDTGFHSTRATKKFIAWIKDYDPDIIHLHNIHGYYINIEELFGYLKKCGKKIIWTLHDCWSFTGHCAYFDYANCDRWKKGCYGCPQKHEYPSRWIIDNSKNNYLRKKKLFMDLPDLTIVTPSQWLKERVKCSFLSDYKIVVINNGIDTKVFTPSVNNIKKRLETENKKIILGVAAVWDYRKGLNSFIELSQKINKDEYTIVLVGLSREQVLKLPNTIIGIEATDSVDELADLYSTAYVFVNPTLEDNYPTTNLEAISCGTPVITFDTGGSPESALVYGKVVKKNDIDGLISAIKDVPKFKMKEHCFSKECTTMEYLNLYQSQGRNE